VASAYLSLWRLIKMASVCACQVTAETADQQRRYADALLRREHREAESARRKQGRIAAAARENSETANL